MSLLLLGDDAPAGPPPFNPEDDRMTYNDARRVMYERWIATWSGPTTHYDNVVSREPGTEYVDLLVRNLGSSQYSLGGAGLRKFQRDAVCIITIHVPLDTGLARADELAQLAANVFEGVQLTGGLDIFQVNVGEVGQQGDMYEVVVRALFHYYETK